MRAGRQADIGAPMVVNATVVKESMVAIVTTVFH
jgi:hypothetical protein